MGLSTNVCPRFIVSAKEILILVDEQDNEIGTDTRENCHAGNGKRHRAYTVFLFHGGKLLLQRRSSDKLLWPGSWDVSYTSHVYPGESYQQAMVRKAKQELNVKIPRLTEAHAFVYVAPQGKNAENEYCRLFIGEFDGKFRANPQEIMETKWSTVDNLLSDMKSNPDAYTPWLKYSLDGFMTRPLSKKYRNR